VPQLAIAPIQSMCVSKPKLDVARERERVSAVVEGDGKCSDAAVQGSITDCALSICVQLLPVVDILIKCRPTTGKVF